MINIICIGSLLMSMPFLHSTAKPPHRDTSHTIQIDSNNWLKLEKKIVKANSRQSDVNVGIVDGKLYDSIATPPFSILTKAICHIDGATVVLDTTGIGDPWEEEPNVEAEVSMFTSDAGETIYTLDVKFYRDGTRGLIVTWKIFNGKSLLLSMKRMNKTS